MRFDHLYRDPDIEEKGFLPDMESISIGSGDEKMFGVMFTPKGRGPHPTMLILHGFPGTERNLDLAHAFRRAGWNSIVFHYRGAWGSRGCFSFGNVLEDVKTALKFVRSDEAVEKYHIDKQNIVLLGHSMGGFAALLTAAGDPDIRACVAMAPFDLGAMGGLAGESEEALAFLKEMFTECIEPLNGATVDGLLDEIVVNSDKWKLVNHAERLLRHNILLIAAGRDILSKPELHCCPLRDALLSGNAGSFEYHLLDSDHSFQDKRILLTEIIEGWLEKQIGV